MKKIKNLSILFILCLTICCTLLLTGCQEMNKLENDCKGSWKFSDFYLLINDTNETIKYSDLDKNSDDKLSVLVKEIGDYYSNLILNLNGNKTNGKVSGTYIKNGITNQIKWWCPEEKLRLLFENFIVYSVQGNIYSPRKVQVGESVVLGGGEGSITLYLCYRSSSFSTYIRFTKN